MLVLMLSIMAWAAPRTAEQAKKIAAEQARKLGITVNEPMLLQKASPKRGKVPVGSTSVEAYYYVFNNNGDNGFTIVSGDDLMPEIVGYSDKGTFSEENMPDNLKAFLKAYCATLEKVVAGDKTAIDNVQELAARRAGETEPKVIVKPLLQATTWNQREPYNNECPLYDGKNRAVTGCVATAMAQIMNKYKHPEALQKDIPAYNDGYGNPIKGVEAAGRTYDWEHMRDEYDNEYTDIEAAAVARLMSDVGRAMNMNYGAISGAITDAPALALPKYFGYDPDFIQYIRRKNVSLSKWIEIIKHELDEERPVYYGGQSFGGGHAFVCDGYDSADFFHINWGWGGYCNAFFDISVLNPNSTSGAGASSTEDGYDMEMDIIIGIRPDNHQEDNLQWNLPMMKVLADNDMLPVIKLANRANAKGKFKVQTNWGMYCDDSRGFKGEIGVAAMDNNGKLDIINTLKIQQLDQNMGYSAATLEKNMPVEYVFPVGKTKLVAVEKPEGSDKWRLMNNATFCHIPLIATETKLDFDDSNLLSVVISNDEIEAVNGTLDLEIANKSGLDYYNRLYIYATDDMNIKPQSYNAYLPVGIDNSMSMKKSVTVPIYDINKIYYIVVTDELGNVLCVKEVNVTPANEPAFVLTGYKLNSIPSDQLEETIEKPTQWGNLSMPLIHSTDTPEMSLDILNLGPKATFEATMYDTFNPTTLMWDRYNTKDISVEIDCGQTKTVTIPSATKGKGMCVWCLENYVSEDGMARILKFGNLQWGYEINGGDYQVYYAYNDGVTDGIRGVETDDKKNAVIYNLAGQRQKAAMSKGIYIIGKKKVLVK